MEQWLEYIETSNKNGQILPFKKIAIGETN